jgi:hypothetical protein
MMVGYKKWGVVLGAVALLATMPSKADAQFVRYSPIFWSFDVNGGAAIPVGALSDVASVGGTVGAGLAYFLNPRFALIAEGSFDFMTGKSGSNNFSSADAAGPDLRAWHYTGGFEYYITDPTSNLLFSFDLGAGGVTYDTDRFTVDDVDCSNPDVACITAPGARVTSTYDQTYFAVNGGLTLGYSFSQTGANNIPMVTLFIAADGHFAFGKKEDSRALAAGYGVEPFGTTIIIPVTLGIRINIP